MAMHGIISCENVGTENIAMLANVLTETYTVLSGRNQKLFKKFLSKLSSYKKPLFIQGLKCQNHIVDCICFIDLENTMWIVVVCIVWPV